MAKSARGGKGVTSYKAYHPIFGNPSKHSIKDKLLDIAIMQTGITYNDFSEIGEQALGEAVRALVNPHYGMSRNKMDKKYTTNCAICSATMALQMLGYDVEAGPRDFDYWRGFSSVFDVDYSDPDNYIVRDDYRKYSGSITLTDARNLNTTNKDVNVAKQYEGQLAQQVSKVVKNWGDGGFGEISVQWKTGGAHSLFIMNNKGIPTIIDSQVGKVYTRSEINTLFSRTTPNYTTVTRLDNARVIGISDRQELSNLNERNSDSNPNKTTYEEDIKKMFYIKPKFIKEKPYYYTHSTPY